MKARTHALTNCITWLIEVKFSYIRRITRSGKNSYEYHHSVLKVSNSYHCATSLIRKVKLAMRVLVLRSKSSLLFCVDLLIY